MKAPGFRNAAMATKTAAKDPPNYESLQLIQASQSSVFLNAINDPINPPANKKKINTKTIEFEKFPMERNVTTIAINIPIIPNKFPAGSISRR